RSLRELQDKTVGGIGPILIGRNEGLQPRPDACSQTGYVAPEPYPGMSGDFPDSEFENVVVNESDQTQLFDRCDEFAARDDASPDIAHAQQAFEIIRLSRRRANHGLACEQQPVL